MIIILAAMSFFFGYFMGACSEQDEQMKRDHAKQREYDKHFWNGTLHELDK